MSQESVSRADAYYARRARETGDPHYKERVLAFTLKEWNCIENGVPCADCDCSEVRQEEVRKEVLRLEREERQARERREQAMMARWRAEKKISEAEDGGVRLVSTDHCRDRLSRAVALGKESNGRSIDLNEGDE